MYLPYLKSVADALENANESIAQRWIEEETVLEVFNRFAISPRKFKNGFGIPIIFYFIAVIREEQPPGNCPVMSKLVNYLLKHNVTPKDVFVICMGFRRVLTDFLLTTPQGIENPRAILGDMATIFNANLAGVLEIFDKTYMEYRQQTLQSKDQEQKFKQIAQIINFVDTKIFIVQGGRIILANQPFLKALGVQNLKQFYEKYSEGWEFLQLPDEVQKSVENGRIEAWLMHLAQDAIPVDVKMYNHLHAKPGDYSLRANIVPGSDPVKLIISMHNIERYKEMVKLERNAIERDALTGFFNRDKLEKAIKQWQKTASADAVTTLTVIVVYNLNDINILEGRQNGDQLLFDLAGKIKKLADETVLCARTGGQHFALLQQEGNLKDDFLAASSLFQQLKEPKLDLRSAFIQLKTDENTVAMLHRSYALCEQGKNGLVQTDIPELLECCGEDSVQTKIMNEIVQAGPLEWHCYYQEIPISSRVIAKTVLNNSLMVNLGTKFYGVIRTGTRLYARLPTFSTIKAVVKEIDWQGKTMKLGYFSYDEHSPLNRRHLRVNVEDGLEARIIAEKDSTLGTVLDVNEQAIAVTVNSPKSFKTGDNVSVSMNIELNTTLVPFNTYATILRIEKEKTGYKMVLLCLANQSSPDLLNQWIAQRQLEIIKKIKRK